MNFRYTNSEKFHTLFFISMVSWIVIVAIIYSTWTISYLDQPQYLPNQFALMISLLPAFLLIGFPISILICFIGGFPIWYFAEKFGAHSIFHAFLAGCVVGCSVNLLFIFLLTGTGSVADNLEQILSFSIFSGFMGLIGIVFAKRIYGPKEVHA